MNRHEVIELLYDRLKAQIAIYSGKKSGTLSVLQDYVNKIEESDIPIICDSCGGNLSGEIEGHRTGCDISKQYNKLFKVSPYCIIDELLKETPNDR